MLNLSMMATWLSDLFTGGDYGLSDDVYNDVIPSGVHRFNRDDS